MLKTVSLLGIALVLATGAAAQGPRPQGAGSTGFNRDKIWELSIGYQFNRINLTGTPFNTNGVNTSAVFFLTSWLGVEGEVGSGFANTHTTTIPPNLTAKSVFAGGGLHLTVPGHHRIEPWIHSVVGNEHFRFTQAALRGNANSLAWLAGGGLDFPLVEHIAVRGQVDALWTQLFKGNQRHLQAVGGLVFKF